MNTEEHYHALNGITIHTIESGDRAGQYIFFLHGFPEFWYAWKNQVSFFSERGYRVIVPDQRGYNLSSKPAGIKSYSLQQLTDDMVALIRHLTDQKVILVGHDWGGVVAWQMAVDYPQLLQHLVIINMPHPQVFRLTLKTNLHQMLRSSYAAFFQIPYLPERICRAFNFALLRRALVKKSKPGTFTRNELDAYQKAWSQPDALRSMIHWYRAYGYRSSNGSGRIEIPVLLIWGKRDQFLIRKMAAQSIEKCTNGRLEMIDDATHWIHHENPHLVNQLIVEAITGETANG